MGERSSKRVVGERFGGCAHEHRVPQNPSSLAFLNTRSQSRGVMADAETSAASGKVGEALGKRLHADDGV